MINGQYLIIVHTFIFVPTPFQHNFHGVERLITVTFVEINSTIYVSSTNLEQSKLCVIVLYNISSVVSKSDIVRARILVENFKVIMVDKSAVEYNRKLSELTTKVHGIGETTIRWRNSCTLRLIRMYKTFSVNL